jgi:hypothetical protein
MDQIEEKKWFVFLGDRHDGPYSMTEMLAKVQVKAISPSSFVWAEGMTDWKLMKEIPDFDGIDDSGMSAPKNETPTEKKAELHVSQGPQDIHSLKAVSVQLDLSPLKETTQTPPPEACEIEKSWKRRRLIRRSLKTAVAVALIGGGTFAYKQGLIDQYIDTAKISMQVQAVSGDLMNRARPHLLVLAGKYSFLSKFISPIPKLKDVSSEDYEKLRTAAGLPLEKGPVVTIAQSTEDPAHPTFYVSSNLPDGAVFDIYFEGKSDTLVGKLHASAKISVTIQKNLGKSEPLNFSPEFILPMGEYQVFATEGLTQPESIASILKQLPQLNAAQTDRLPAGLKLLARRTYFLGGYKDDAYIQKLREYQNQLQQKSRVEIADLKDLGSVLEKQIQSTIQQFKAIRKGRGVKGGKKQAWANFHTEWIKSEFAWLDRFSKLPPDAIRDEYVHAPLYEMAKQAGVELQKLHDLQNDYFENRLDERSLEIQLGTATSVVESAYLAFKTKTEQAEKPGT